METWTDLSLELTQDIRVFLNLLICLEYILCSAGPDTWHKDCPIASKGERQSPIDLKASEAKHDSKLEPVVVSYPAFTDAKVLNNGHSVQFQPGAGHQSGNKINTKPVPCVRVHAWQTINKVN